MSFNLIIDSLNGSGDDGNLTYGIDWSFLAPEQEYDMTFSYRSTAPVSGDRSTAAWYQLRAGWRALLPCSTRMDHYRYWVLWS